MREDCREAPDGITIEALKHLPVSGKAKKERRKAWRRHIIACAENARDAVKSLEGYETWFFTVDIEFFLPSNTKNDLDNLAKPVIDTLFKPGVPNRNQDPEITGKILPLADDLQLRQLNLRKMLADDPEKCGAIIRVCWTRA